MLARISATLAEVTLITPLRCFFGCRTEGGVKHGGSTFGTLIRFFVWQSTALLRPSHLQHRFSGSFCTWQPRGLVPELFTQIWLAHCALPQPHCTGYASINLLHPTRRFSALDSQTRFRKSWRSPLVSLDTILLVAATFG